MNLNLVLNTLGFLALILAGVLGFFLIIRDEQLKSLRGSMNKLLNSFNDLDEQAKLIVRTDLELNKTQEELDKRLSSLNALHKISRLISTTLDVSEIFQRLGKVLSAELGFEKALLLMFDENKNLISRMETGFNKKIVEHIITNFHKDHMLNGLLREARVISSLNAPKQKKERIYQLFGTEHFIFAPILSQDGTIGIFFVGHQSDAKINESDEELVSILANQIGQSIENAELFEQVYRSRQDLESKIQDRTKELAHALEELKKISKAKTDFVSAVSHELRTPLTSIKGYASILITGKIGALPPEVKERLEKINKHSDNLVKLINDLLDISRIESGRVEMNFTKHNIASIVENIRDLLMPQVSKKNIQLKINIPKLPDIPVDNSQIERVFINLLSNAIKFTPENGTIMIDAELKDQSVLFKISDNGIGIKEEEIPKLFQEFYRIDNEINQNVKGTGLGLVLVKNIIEAHQGKIWLTSKTGSGTTFYFTLPINHT